VPDKSVCIVGKGAGPWERYERNPCKTLAIGLSRKRSVSWRLFGEEGDGVAAGVGAEEFGEVGQQAAVL
jgi:hypothetical protein